MAELKDTDSELASSANFKIAAGEKATAEERAALRRVKAEYERESRFRAYVAVPQKDFVAMTGKKRQQVYEQVDLYEMPEVGASVNVADFIRWIFDFVSKHAFIFRQVREGALVFGGPETDSLEKVRAETHQLLRIKRLKAEGKLVDMEAVREQLGPFAARIRECGEQLRREFGDEAQEILNEAIDDAARRAHEALSGDGGAEGSG